MPTGSIQVYASVAGQAAPLAGVQVAVLDESGVTVARLTTDEAGAAEATNLPAPNASYSLQETNTTVRPYAVYRLRADASGWQSQILDGVQVFDGQQTVARLYRQGQASQTVVVQHIITDGTIDERILKALQYKDRTQSALIDAVRANLRK